MQGEKHTSQTPSVLWLSSLLGTKFFGAISGALTRKHSLQKFNPLPPLLPPIPNQIWQMFHFKCE